MKYVFRAKFYIGIIIIVLSFLMGNYAKVKFILYWSQPSFRNWMIIVYLLTWLMLAVGIWWVGREYADAVKRYTSYRFYGEHARKGVIKAVDVGVKSTKKVVKVGRETSRRAVAVGKVHGKRVVEAGKVRGKEALKLGRKRVSEVRAKARSKIRKLNT